MNVFSILALLLALAILAYFWVRKASMVQALAIANFVVFVISLATADRYSSIAGSELLNDLAFRTRYVTEWDWSHLHTVVTAAFLHADFVHILANMLILLMAGLPFEERLGRGRFLIVYFFSSIVAVLLHVVWNQFTLGHAALDVPVVGASGAVFGILGGFAATYPRDQIPMILVFFVLPRVPVILAAIVLSLFEIVALVGGAPSGVAHAAHIGGAVGGAISAPLVKPPEKKAGVLTAGRKLDYEKLASLAHDDKTRRLVDRVRENSDAAELQRAWLDRLFVSLRCPQCGDGYAETSPGTLECDKGHREKYVAS
jgi:membrane associated rhomboid family serine protease